METALLCIRCGAPLPATTAGATFATCPYCGTTLHLARDGAASPANAAPPSDADAARERRDQERRRFGEMLKERLEAGDKPYDALCAAARAHVDGVGGSLDAIEPLARATLAIAHDFDEENHTDAFTDATSLARIVEAYLKASVELATVSETSINLPFLSAAADGPKHLQRTLVASNLAALAQRAPFVAPKPAPPAPPAPAARVFVPVEDEPVEKKKKGWWPFG